LVQRKPVLPAAVSIRDAGQSIVHLYTLWARPDQAEEWRKAIESSSSDVPQPPKR